MSGKRALGLTLAAGLSAGLGFGLPAAADSGGMTLTAKLYDKASVAPDRFILDPPLRRGWDYYKSGSGSPALQQIDLDTLGPIGQPRDISGGAGQFYAGPQAPVNIPPSAIDTGRHIVFTTYFDATSLGEVGQIVSMDERTGALHTLSLDDQSVAGAGGEFVGASVQGMDYFPPTETLYVLAQLRAADLGYGTYAADEIQVLALDTSRESLTVRWVYSLDQCHLAGEYGQVGFGRGLIDDALFFGCDETTNLDLATAAFRVGGPQAIRIDMPDPNNTATFSAERVPIVGAFRASVFDAASERLHMLYQTAAYSGVWTLDGRHMQFINNASTGENGTLPSGIDPSTGRLYVDSAHALQVLDGRQTPPGQGLSFGRYADGNTASISEVEVDYITHNVFVPGHDTGGYYWWVIHDTVPVGGSAQASDPDALTSQKPEDPATTDVNFYGQGSSFGFEAMLVGGYNGAIDNACGEVQCNANAALQTNPPGNPAPPPPPVPNGNYSTSLQAGARDILMGYVQDVELSNDEGSAHSLGAEADDATKADFRNYDNDARQLSAGALSTGQWPYQDPATEQTFCSGSGRRTVKVPGAASGTILQGSSSVACDYRSGDPGASVSATAEAADSYVTQDTAGDALVSVGRALSGVTVTRDAKRGSVTTVSADVYGINLENVVHIQHVHAQATSFSHGHAGTAGGTFSRYIEGVVAPGFTCTTECTPQSVAAAINANLPTRLQITFPAPDGVSGASCLLGCDVPGSPGGYQSHVGKDSWQYLSDVAENADQTHHLVAMQAIAYNDGVEFNRLVLKFAGVSTETHYGVVPIPDVVSTSESGPTAAPVLGSTVERIIHLFDTVPTAAPTLVPAQFRTDYQRVIDGLRIAWSDRGRLLLMLATLWLLGVLPAYLAIRRAALARQT